MEIGCKVEEYRCRSLYITRHAANPHTLDSHPPNVGTEECIYNVMLMFQYSYNFQQRQNLVELYLLQTCMSNVELIHTYTCLTLSDSTIFNFWV